MAKKGNAAGLIRFNKRVKQIKNAHPRMTHSAAQQQAKREGKSGRKVGATKKAAPKKRKKAGHPTRWKESKKTVVSSSVGGTVGTVAHTRSHLKKQLEESLAWALLARDSADKVRDRKKKGKKVTEIKRELRAINGIKKRR